MKFDKYADKYDYNFMGKGSKKFYIDLIKELNIKDGDSVLDVGCGTGSILSYIGNRNTITGFGLDISENMLAIAQEKNPNCSFIIGNSAILPFADQSMDVVIACMAYHHFPNQRQFREEAWRVLKPGGSLYISDPRFPGIIRGILNTFFQDAGFHTTKKNTYDFEKRGFITKAIVKDMYVQILHFVKE